MASGLPPPQPSLCAVCGERLDGTYWVTGYPAATHERCVDWSGRVFPYARLLRPLRTAYSKSQRVQRLIRELAWWLRQAEQQWPIDAPQLLAEGRERIAWTLNELKRMGVSEDVLKRLR